jgi:hypothetical protein
LEKFGKGRVKLGFIGGFFFSLTTLGWLFLKKMLIEL